MAQLTDLRGRLTKLRRPAGRAFYRNRFVREVAAASTWPRRRRDAPELAHLALYKEDAEGPVQRDEALLLHALIRVLRPQTVIEIGFYRGHSALNFLRALTADARLYSFDVASNCVELAADRFGHDSRF